MRTISSKFRSEDNTQKESINIFDQLNRGQGISSGFLSDIFNEEIMTPHNEMTRIREMLFLNAFADNAVNTVADLMLGKYQKVVSEDEATQKFFEESFCPESKIYRALRISARDFLGYGNFYVEKLTGKVSGNVKKFEPIAHPERTWRRIKDNEIFDYVLQVPTNIADKNEMNQYTVGYGKYNKRTVYGVKYNKDELIDGKLGQGDYKYYGQSPLASVVSDHKILKEIERSMAMFARFKSVAKKIISIKGNDGNPLSSGEFNRTVNDWRSLNDYENFVENGKEFDIKDLDYAGNQVNFKNMTDYLKRKITSVLGPEFYFHGENTTHAVSNSQQTTFYLRIQSWRQQFLEPWNEVLREIAEQYNLSKDVHLELGPFDFETDKEKREKALKAFNAGAITINEAREMMGIPEAEDEEVGRAYKWDVQDQQPMQPLQQKLDELIEDEGAD